LNDNFDFTYNAEITPFGKDYVNTFLTETKTGNFVHYATAATLIYRSLGIPARYVSGYHIPYEMIMGSDDTNDDTDGWITDNTIYPKIKNVKVSNQSMYAWVEIYKDGEGWVPQDVCEKVFDELAEASDNSENAEEGQNSDNGKESTSDEDKPKKEKKELFKTYFETAYSNEKTDEVKTKFRLFADDSVKKVVKFVKICLVAVVLIALLWIMVGLLRFVFAKNNKKAEIIFRRLEKKTGINSGIRDISFELEKRGASEEDRAVLEKTIQKAMFSEKGITDEEVKMLIKSYKNIMFTNVHKEEKR
jgi:hypothetical protein